MPKIINLILFPAILLILIFVPLARTEATLTYIGIQIDSVKRLATMGEICLLPTTVMKILDSGQNVVTGSTVTTTATVGPTASPTSCSANQIWTDLVDISSGNYTIRIETPVCFGYWHKDSGLNMPYKCWYKGTRDLGLGVGRGENCIQVCQDYNTSVGGSCGDFSQICSPPSSAYCNDQDENCDVGKFLLPAYSMQLCWSSAHYWTGYSTQASQYISNNCVSCRQGCSWSDSTAIRLCVCHAPTAVYDFPFAFSAP